MDVFLGEGRGGSRERAEEQKGSDASLRECARTPAVFNLESLFSRTDAWLVFDRHLLVYDADKLLNSPAPTMSESMTTQIKGFWQVNVSWVYNRKKPLPLPVVFRNRTLWALQYKQETCWRMHEVLSKESEMLVTLTFYPQLRQPPVAAGYRTFFFLSFFFFKRCFKKYKSLHKRCLSE